MKARYYFHLRLPNATRYIDGHEKESIPLFPNGLRLNRWMKNSHQQSGNRWVSSWISHASLKMLPNDSKDGAEKSVRQVWYPWKKLVDIILRAILFNHVFLLFFVTRWMKHLMLIFHLGAVGYSVFPISGNIHWLRNILRNIPILMNPKVYPGANS